MARGGKSSIANGAPRASSSLVKVKTKIKKENKNKGKQRTYVEDEEDEEDDEPTVNGKHDGESNAQGETDEEDEQDGSPKGAKRSRVNEDGDSRPADKGKYKERVKTLPRDADGFIPGSIVRIKLHNFVTYDDVEFGLGPYLNMIIGPNGTGKSSIACAICLGLNWSPSILGRASELNSFVKIGTESGFIEIELKGPRGKGNLVIRRNLTATSKGSTFTLNGHPATGREITSRMLELSVQVGNMCSFLPQDKVSEFAAMSPQQLLRETQRAAGDENLTNWHDILISAGKELKQMLQSIKEENDQLRQMVERNEGIERDVQRYLERKKIEHEIELLEVLIPIQNYRELRNKYVDAKAEQRKLHEKVMKLKAKNEPAHALLKKLDAEYKELDKTRDAIKKSTQAKFKKMTGKNDAIEKLEGEAEELTLKLDRLKQTEKERIKRIKALEQEIVKTREELAKPPDVKLEKEEDLAAEMRQLNVERQGVVYRKGALDDKIKSNIDNRAKFSASSTMARLEKLDDVNVRKLQALGRWDRDTHDAILWLRKNRDKFKMEVFEPPIMVLTVPDRRFVNAVESCFNAAQLKTFVAQCQEDMDTFNHYINDSPTLGRKTRVSTWYRIGQEGMLPPPPMTREELPQLGFAGYALDYVDCPQGMRWYLQRELNLHRTAIGLDEKRVDVNKAMEAVARFEPNGSGGGATFINGMTMNNVSRSRYGRKAIGNVTRDIQPARNLVTAHVDPEIKQKIDASIASNKQDIAMCDNERKELEEQMKSVLEEDKEFQKRYESIKTRRNAIRQAAERKARLESKLKRNQIDLETQRNTPPADVERVNIKRELLKICKKRVQIAKEYTELARAIITEQTENTRIGLQFLQVGTNKAALKDLCERKDEKYHSTLAEFNKADQAYNAVKAESKRALDDSKLVLNEVTPELREEYQVIENVRLQYERELNAAKENGLPLPPTEGVDLRTSEELREELETQRANLDLNLASNPGVVEQYEKRKREIAELEKTIEEKQKKAAKVERNIRNARDNWQPALEKLVASIGEKFSASFDRIGCAGEIRISQHEDYEKWAIDILVKFRDSEKLQLLTAHRQSGGERSLTTILYLLSLTEEARAPFSLVDEINQGMDQRAERTVHNEMVEVTCKEDSAQYFLITPKLLPDLRYHARMKILCVNNGEWLPEEKMGNMMKMIEGFLQARKSGARSAASAA
ncbi:P-loop containing nucleoside triphosphate hydrolase protein [Tricholoma matsutake]|nr:P-loop containing nucleoside triphosphate hydrolase protein [Tricholoma matsutake 945]